MTLSKTDLSHLAKRSSRPTPISRRADTKRTLLLLVIFLIGALISSAVFFAVCRRERNQAQLAFELETQDLFNAIRERFRIPRDLLQVVASFFAASESVTRDEFRTVVRPVLERHPSMTMIEWMPLVSDADREAFVSAVRAEGFRNFRLQQKDPLGGLMPATRRSDYLPVLFVEPLNPTILGLDAGASTREDDEVTRARATGRPTASPPLSLIEDPSDVFSVVYYKPVLQLETGSGPSDVGAEQEDVLSSRSAASDRGSFTGMVTAVLRIERVVNDAVDAVRRSEWRAADKDGKKAIKSSRYLLLANP